MRARLVPVKEMQGTTVLRPQHTGSISRRMFNLISLLIGVLAIPWVLLAVLPLIGALNWLVIPWALLGLFFGVLSRGTAGRNLNLIVLIVAVVRLWLGGGLF